MGKFVSSKFISIKHWADDDKPREKMLSKGPASLSNAELIGILISSGAKSKSAIELGRQVLHTVGDNLENLGKLDVGQLKKVRGIGVAKAARIMAAVEINRRRQSGYMHNRKTINVSRDAAMYFKPILSDYQFESFHVLFLNSGNRVLQHKCISYGGVTNTVVDPRVIFKEALDYGACRLILCHNHPSGNLKPSMADLSLTEKIKEAGRLLDITVLDHIIVSDVGYCSIMDGVA